MLENVGWQTVDSVTRWTDGPQRFAGVPLAALLERVGARGSRLVASALNDYAVDFAIDEAVEHDALLAMKQNGAWMKVRDKGPVWIIIPHVGDPREISERHANWMVWQLRSLRVE